MKIEILISAIDRTRKRADGKQARGAAQTIRQEIIVPGKLPMNAGSIAAEMARAAADAFEARMMLVRASEREPTYPMRAPQELLGLPFEEAYHNHKEDEIHE